MCKPLDKGNWGGRVRSPRTWQPRFELGKCMVPKRVGEKLRQRRLFLVLRQADIAKEMGTTRAYVSAIERGVDWDPDADKLVKWAQTLGWPDDYVLRSLGRPVMSTTAPATLTADLLAEIK